MSPVRHTFIPCSCWALMTCEAKACKGPGPVTHVSTELCLLRPPFLNGFARWHMPAILPLGRQRRGGPRHKFQAITAYIAGQPRLYNKTGSIRKGEKRPYGPGGTTVAKPKEGLFSSAY